MDKKKNHIDDHPLNPQETKTNLYKRPHNPLQPLSTNKSPHKKTKLKDKQTKNSPHPSIADIKNQTSL